MNKMEELLTATRLGELVHKKEEEGRHGRAILWALAIVGAVAAVAAIAYGVYRFFMPDYLEDFDEEFEDDFDDDFFNEETAE